MKSKYHLEITRKALEPFFSEDALQTVLSANVNQDRVQYQFGHPYIHFDSNSFDTGFAYIEQQENLLVDSISQGEFVRAREALGRIAHSWQDYYSHSNYISLWVKGHPDAKPEDINPADPEYLDHPDLHSGEVYGLWDFIALVPVLTKLVTPLMPEDSHAKMNLDSPASGPLFIFNTHAALKRTNLEYDRIMSLCMEKRIPSWNIDRFRGKSQEEKV